MATRLAVANRRIVIFEFGSTRDAEKGPNSQMLDGNSL